MSRNKRTITFLPGDIWEFTTAHGDILHYLIMSNEENNTVYIKELETDITEYWPSVRVEYPPYANKWNRLA